MTLSLHRLFALKAWRDTGLIEVHVDEHGSGTIAAVVPGYTIGVVVKVEGIPLPPERPGRIRAEDYLSGEGGLWGPSHGAIHSALMRAGGSQPKARSTTTFSPELLRRLLAAADDDIVELKFARRGLMVQGDDWVGWVAGLDPEKHKRFKAVTRQIAKEQPGIAPSKAQYLAYSRLDQEAGIE